MKQSILITGASGFIGSFLVEEALCRGFETWAGVRASSSRKYLQEPGLHFLELDFAHTDRLFEQLKAHRCSNSSRLIGKRMEPLTMWCTARA